MYVYVVTVQPVSYLWAKVSQEGYHSLDEARKFIKNRSDNPVQYDESGFKYLGSNNVYEIHEVKVI